MSRTPAQAAPQMQPPQLTPDETRVLAECERESLIYRSIPLGLITFFATQFAMQRNIITAKAKWVKLGASLFTGYLLGKISYAPTCRKKILTQIPESHLAHAILTGDARELIAPQQHDSQSSSTRDPNEAVVFVPNSAESDTHTVPVGVNQYGDPIYATTK
ncbi:unnamed protein product [Adineta ricciae]|uniref:OCIA domain-containing protein n=1 Tax=Adineta ricciae TaxID=249248 RepID=A0A815ZBL9_ADIRI|nr:unnamed protein product [Adineta ricciae]